MTIYGLFGDCDGIVKQELLQRNRGRRSQGRSHGDWPTFCSSNTQHQQCSTPQDMQHVTLPEPGAWCVAQCIDSSRYVPSVLA